MQTTLTIPMYENSLKKRQYCINAFPKDELKRTKEELIKLRAAFNENRMAFVWIFIV